jgi:hypothetical protein
MKPNDTDFSALSRLFSSSVFRQLAEMGRSPLFARLLRDTGLLSKNVAHETVGEMFDAAFAILRRAGRRDEYVYRAALTHNIFLGRHSLKTACLLTEFRAGSCKADLAILNGTASVYEIKSERDSLARLENQILNYRKVFAKVYVVVAEPFVQDVIKRTTSDIGVMSLARWDRIQTVREAADLPNSVCPSTIFESLRLEEARDILQKLNVEVPDVPNTKLHTAMRNCFALQDPAAVHREMVQTLKRTRNLSSLTALLVQLPMSLQPAALAILVRQKEHESLVAAVRTPIGKAMTWA